MKLNNVCLLALFLGISLLQIDGSIQEGREHKELHKAIKHGHYPEHISRYRHRHYEMRDQESKVHGQHIRNHRAIDSSDMSTSNNLNSNRGDFNAASADWNNMEYLKGQNDIDAPHKSFSKLSAEAEQLTGQELVDYVNSKQTLWRAKSNGHFENYPEKTRWGLMGVNHIENSIKARKTLSETRFLDIELPTNFDAREKWPKCESLFAIRDQSSCGSCWAFGAVEAMSDRICIASNGSIQVTLSADDLLSCCRSCGYGCNGGDPLSAWKFWVTNGIVTGSNFTEREGCRPYPFPPCHLHSDTIHYICPNELFSTPKCERKCQSSYTAKSYNQDKYYGQKAYAVDNDVKAIQKELYIHGPMEIAFEVYEDFMNYDSGIYMHTAGKLGGGHAVKLVGWGEENGVPYWTVANSWNTDFGEKGFFRILRGKDECGIESGVVAGLPDLKRTGTTNHY